MHHSWQSAAFARLVRARLVRARRGAAAVEFALTAPLLLGLLAPVADLGMAYSRQLQVQQAAQAGAQYATLHPWNSNSVQSVTSAVNAASALAGLNVSPPPQQICGCPNGAAAIGSVTCDSLCPDGATAGYYVVVSAQLPYRTMMPFSFLGRSVTLTARSTVRIQQAPEMSRNHRAPSSRHPFGDRRGAVVVEVALLMRALIMLMFGIVELGRALWVKNALDFSVAQAARCARINPTLCKTADQIKSYAADQAGIAFDTSDFTVSNPSCGNQVAARYPMQLAIPFAPLTVTINAAACYPS